MNKPADKDFCPNKMPDPLDFQVVEDAIDTLIDALAAAALTRGEQCIGIVVTVLNGKGPEGRLSHCGSVMTKPSGEPLEPSLVCYVGNEMIDAAYQMASDTKEQPIC